MNTNNNTINQIKEKNSETNYIVGIGASAGGLEALQKFLSALPPDTGFPFVIVQHLSPDYKSLLGEILSKNTEMPVIQAENGAEIKPNCVYVIQPGKNMRICNGKLILSAQKEKELNLPIDIFFRSLAEEAGSRAIAIILSGTGSDGSNGIKDIKEHNGMIIVQDTDSAKFDGMPRSAMRTGLVDTQASPEKIAMEIQHISNSANKIIEPLKTDRQIDNDLMKKIYIILKKVSNINFTHYKQTTILRRIERRMMLARKETLSEYVDYLYKSPDEVRTLSKEVLIGVTNFFRDPEYFQCLKDNAINEILQRTPADESVRVWVAGCSTGEEAYSIAILFCEVMESLKIKRTVKIFATDLDVEAISVAGKGTYSDNIIGSVSPARLSRYFSHRNNTYVVNRDVRKMIIFSPHNVFQDPPFGRLDLISCRNMLIYFQPVLQNDLFALFHASLKDNGYLFLGKSEAIGAFTDAFPVIDATAKIFRHRGDVKIAGQKNIPYLQASYLDDDISDDYEARYSHRSVSEKIAEKKQEIIDIFLLEEFMPACLVINDKNDIIHLYGENSNYIHIPVGRFTNNIFDLITDALKIPSSTLLKEARDKNSKVQYKNISFCGEKENATITLTAMPITKRGAEQEQLYALVFVEKSQRGEMQNATSYDIDRVASQRITDLELELRETQGMLDRSVAEQECINEELQAANEELLTANEELQSSNEELQSVNEELYTVNSEYQLKLSELADLNDDIANFLSSTLTGIIFVDNKLNIRRYTDYVTTEFSVMDHDIGRSLKFISYHFPTVDISEICDNVLKTLVPDEREITTSKNKVFFMRVAPYRSTENKILGCVITLVDVTTQKQGQFQLETTEKKLTLAQEAVEAKSDYLSRISHEIRTPMSTLLVLTKDIKRHSDDKEVLNTKLDKLTETIEYITSIVTDISEASKYGHNSYKQISEAFRLRSIINNVQAFMSEKAKNADLTLEISLADDFDPYYLGNDTALQQILINLLNNSIKYTPKYGAISLKAFETDTSASKDISSLCIIISDTGVGIKKEFIPHIFEPYTRENTNDENASNSMGLGLSIVYNLIKSMNGKISVESEYGKGTTFTIHIDFCKRKKDNKDNNVLCDQDEDFNKKLSSLNVLIAEDNALNRIILGEILNTEGISFSEAIDGAEAVKLYHDAPAGTFDCILMDMRMPKLDGIRATTEIRNSDKSDAKTIPIISVSANGFSDDILKATEAGINGYIIKPINREKLFETMRSVINIK